jgi:toxin-antitoxin system PIN domain toxin
VIAVDTNILVYAHRSDAQWHQNAERAVRSLAEGSTPWAIPWPCVHEFLAIASHPRIFRTPTPVPAALDQVEAWLESPSLVIIGEPDGYWRELRTLATEGRVAGPRVHDARVAAICLAHQIRELWTADRDFSFFPRLKARNPLVG